jgi:hypothetical protein
MDPSRKAGAAGAVRFDGGAVASAAAIDPDSYFFAGLYVLY